MATYRVRPPGATASAVGMGPTGIGVPGCQRCAGRQANYELQGKMAIGEREGSTGQRLDLIQVGAQPPLIWMISLLPALQDRRDRQNMGRSRRTPENSRHPGSIADQPR